jgi:hypothetical protein
LAILQRPMPLVAIPVATLKPFGTQWSLSESLSRTPPFSSTQLSGVFDEAVGASLASFLGGIPIVGGRQNVLLPPQADCVEVGPVTIVGGVRVQNFDVGYRPDGVRFVLDSKTLNDTKSVGKNFWNMVNDLGTEATTVHLRFPSAVVAFVVAIPVPCVSSRRTQMYHDTLRGMTGRDDIGAAPHKAEAIAFVTWDPTTGTVDPTFPAADSPLRLERLSEQIEAAYVNRFAGSPPHRP